MESIYYSPRGYWRGSAAISKVASAAKVKRATAPNWLSKQAIWQIYLPPPKQINFSHFDVTVPNEVHQDDLLFLSHDGGYKYALTVADVASRYKQAEPLKTKSSTEVASAFERIYRRNRTYLIPNNDFRNQFLAHSFRGPFVALVSKKAVISASVNVSLLYFSCKSIWLVSAQSYLLALDIIHLPESSFLTLHNRLNKLLYLQIGSGIGVALERSDKLSPLVNLVTSLMYFLSL